MHRGSALAGHYFAYIKDLHSTKWYKFDDSRVTLAEEPQLDDARGVGGTSGLHGGASPYMCMYRRVAPGNATNVPEEELPEDLKAMVLASLQARRP